MSQWGSAAVCGWNHNQLELCFAGFVLPDRRATLSSTQVSERVSHFTLVWWACALQGLPLSPCVCQQLTRLFIFELNVSVRHFIARVFFFRIYDEYAGHFIGLRG